MVIDWDVVRAVPAVLARRPPIWLRDSTDEHERTHVRSDAIGISDADLLDPSRYDPGNGRFLPDDQQVRTYFEERLIQGLDTIYEGYSRGDCYEEAYGKGRWIRRVARFAIRDKLESMIAPVLAHLEDDWETFKRGHSKRGGRKILATLSQPDEPDTTSRYGGDG
ncbi:hypothetical protein K470DRAFT_268556 [Piedraia hortae CBS 480.64]|uniref:Uncharacterized protein n=1 Tax=Piedraia hortae CBS 480.64 TaxID=1314780 RepID=A0A6A7C672_9PEZI|nr:hypothetical protein K470DRAFT_268556 [Piedraia hortae CBS 480.64]